MAEYIIRNGALNEDYYLKDIRREKNRDMLFEDAFGDMKARKKRKTRKKEETDAKYSAVATYTQDETQAIYFPSRKAAEKMIREWPVLRFATIVQA